MPTDTWIIALMMADHDFYYADKSYTLRGSLRGAKEFNTRHEALNMMKKNRRTLGRDCFVDLHPRCRYD